jgi:hypothetical protein
MVISSKQKTFHTVHTILVVVAQDEGVCRSPVDGGSGWSVSWRRTKKKEVSSVELPALRLELHPEMGVV